uniref:Ufd2P_core domain-containing protein n=1 Tax=Macrostomum lignano TaxID=282301 RepID=A0A1I8J0R3_9PLAT
EFGGGSVGGGLGVRPAQLLATVSLAGSRRPDHLASLCRIVGQADTAPHHARLALSIFRRAVGQTQPHSGLIGALLSDADTRREIMRGFACWLEADQPAVASAAEEADALALMDASVVSASAIERAAASVSTNMASIATAMATLADDSEDVEETGQRQEAEFAALTAEAAPACRTSVLLLLLHCLDRSAPNLAHFLLGYRMDGRLAETQLQEPGVNGYPKTCLHSLMSLMRRAADPAATAVFADSDHADFALAYRLAFCLAVNVDTSPSFLRYLRAGSEFLAGQLAFLLASARRQQPQALTPRRQALGRLQKAWLLRLLAVDIRCAALSNQRGHAVKLVRALLGADWTSGAERSALDQVYSYGAPQRDDTLLSLLDSLASEELLAAELADDDDEIAAAASGTVVDIDDESTAVTAASRTARPELLGGATRLRHLNRHSVEEMLRACEEQLPAGARVTSLQALAANLYSGAAAAAAASGAGVQQRAELEAEIRLVLRLAEKRNARRLAEQGRLAMADGWRQTAEVLFSACPPDWSAPTPPLRRALLAEFLDRLLAALGGDSDASGASGLAASLSNTVALLTSGLVHSLLASGGAQDSLADDSTASSVLQAADRHASVRTASPTVGGVASSTSMASESSGGSRELQQLLQLLRSLARALLRHRSSAQSIRGNLYASACFLLSAAGLLRSGRPAVAALTVAAAAAGRDLAELTCRDAADAHPVTRLLATSLLDSAMRLDPAGSADWQTHLTSRGYLDHFVDALAADSEALEAAVSPAVSGSDDAANSEAATLAPLFLAASRLALLCRLASSQAGASALLHAGAIARLADCAAFGRRPPPPPPTSTSSGSAASAMDFGVDPAWLGVGPEPAVRYRLLLMPALRAAGALMASLGWKNQLAAQQALLFVDRHWDAFSACSGLAVRCPDDPEQWEELSLFAGLLRQCCSALVTHQRSPLLGRVERWLSEALANVAPIALQLPQKQADAAASSSASAAASPSGPIDHRLLLRRSDTLAALTGLLARLLACDLHLQQQQQQDQKQQHDGSVASSALLPPYLEWLPLLYQQLQQEQQQGGSSVLQGGDLRVPLSAALTDWRLSAGQLAASLEHLTFAVWSHVDCYLRWARLDPGSGATAASATGSSAAVTSTPGGIRRLTAASPEQRQLAAASPAAAAATAMPIAGLEDDTRVRQYLLGGRFESELGAAPNLTDDWSWTSPRTSRASQRICCAVCSEWLS